MGVPALVCGNDAPAALADAGVVVSGWVDFHAPGAAVPGDPPPDFPEDAFGRCAIMVLAPCVADVTKLRLIAHTSGDLAPVFPFLNAEMSAASYNRETETLTYHDVYRMVSLYPHRITIAKADGIVDAWRVLESIRCLVNRTWARRGEITPAYQQRSRPPALEIYRRLPGTNCRECGGETCMAFACRLWRGEGRPMNVVRHSRPGPTRTSAIRCCRSVRGLASSQAWATSPRTASPSGLTGINDHLELIP